MLSKKMSNAKDYILFLLHLCEIPEKTNYSEEKMA